MKTKELAQFRARLGSGTGTGNSPLAAVKAAVFCVALFASQFVCESAEVPATVAPVYAEAKSAMDAGNFPAAAQILEDALRELPANTDGVKLLNLALGTAYLRAGQHAKAVAPLEKVGDDALLADALRGSGRLDEARRLYEKVAVGESVNARYSRARIAELDSAEEKVATKAVERLFSAADGFSALGSEDAAYFDEATKLYEAIARKREWRGEATARAIFSLGEVQRLRKSYPEAIAFYQRCFVSWARFAQWGARSYLRAAECFEALGRRAEAIAHLREMMRKSEKYGRLPEFEEAKKRLRGWGEVVP